MAGIEKTFFGLPLATIQELKTEYIKALKAVALGQSYSISGRSLQRGDMRTISRIVQELQAAEDNATGKRITRTVANFRGAAL